MVDLRVARRTGSFAAFAALAGMALTGMAPAAGRAADYETLHARYAVNLVGFRIGDLSATGSLQPQSYKIDLNAQLTGLAAMVSSIRLALASSGTVRKEHLAPMAYATSAVNSQETRTLRMALKAGTVKAVEIVPPPQFYGERVPVTDANKRNILDPTSALIMPVPKNESLEGPAACNRTLPIYDGYARFDIALHYVGTRSVTLPGYQGPVAICSARYHPISGHMVNSRSTAFMEQNTGIEVWLAPVESAHVVVPLRVMMPTMAGDLDIQAVEFQVSASDAPSSH